MVPVVAGCFRRMPRMLLRVMMDMLGMLSRTHGVVLHGSETAGGQRPTSSPVRV